MRAAGVALVGLSLAACSVGSDLGALAGALKPVDAGPMGDAGHTCFGQIFDPLWVFALGAAYPSEGARFFPSGTVNVPSVGPGVTLVVRPLSDDRWIWLRFGEPVVDGALPRSLGWPSCAADESRLFSPELPDGGYYQSTLTAQVRVVTSGTEPGAKIDLYLDEATYVDPTGATISLPELHIVESLPDVPDGG